MKFNDLTYMFSIVILCVTALYTLMYSGLTGVLMSSAVALIAAAFIEQFELVAALTVIFALFYTLFLKRILRRLEPFQDLAIANRVGDMKNKYHPASQSLANPRLEPAGVYNPAVEGFENVSKDAKEGAPSDSSSAPASKTGHHQVDPEEVKDVTSAIEKKSDEQKEHEEFKSATNGLFKLGQMPSEHADGPKLDAGKTIMKAMSALDPNTISAMTTDTKKLLETQKGLMGMLQQMRPVLADGKELLQTFSGMFGGSKFNLGDK